MRRSVTKPKTTLKPAMKPHAPAEVMAKPVSTLAMKHSVKHVDPVRMHRAQATPKSGSVQRFNPNQSPDNQPTYHHKPARTKSTGQTTNHPTAAPQPPPDLFEAAIAKATSHEEPAHKPKTKKKRGVSIMAGVAAFLILGGFLAYLNMANIQLRVASFQAGFTAHMPDYNPTGYDLTDIKNEHGKITLSYRSGESSYHISQQTTNWNSQTLGDDIIASAGNKTVQSKGRTIYFYDDTASWVSGGVRYDVTGNAHLSPDVVVDIATSM
jgi:hypothetical protein